MKKTDLLGSGEQEVTGCKAGAGPGCETDLSVVAATRAKPNAADGCFLFAG
jgi:hypothetical protein